MNNELINALEDFDKKYIDENIDFIFSNIEFFEKIFMYLIENKKNESIFYLIENFQDRIPLRILEIGFYDSIIKKNNNLFDFYYEKNIIKLNSDRNLPFIIACDHSNVHIAKNLLTMNQLILLIKTVKLFQKPYYEKILKFYYYFSKNRTYLITYKKNFLLFIKKHKK